MVIFVPSGDYQVLVYWGWIISVFEVESQWIQPWWEIFFSVVGGKAPLPANRGTNPARNGDNCKIEPSISGIEASEQFSARAIDTSVQNLCV